MTDAVLQRPPALARLLGLAGRSLAVVATWLTALVIGVGGFLSGSLPRESEIIGFGLAFAVATAVAGVAALAVGGRSRLAIEAGVAIVAAVLIPAGFVAGMLWLAPTTAQSLFGLGSQEVLMLRRRLVALVGEIIRPRRQITPILGPAGPIFGLVAGAVAGLLMRLGRRRPGVAAALAVGLLVAIGASASVAGRLVTDVVLERRKEGGNWAVSSLYPIEVAGTIGAVAGSVVGAVAACGALQGPRGGTPPVAEESLP